MKFSNGQWLTKENVTIRSPHHVHDIEQERNAITLYAPCRSIETRGDTLDGPLLTIRLSSPLPDVFHVQISHFQGQYNHGPNFQILAQEIAAKVIETDDAISLVSGESRVAIRKQGQFGLEFFRDEIRLTGSTYGSIGYIQSEQQTFLREQLSLSVGEYVYGLGERFTSFIKNGQIIDIWNEDGGTSTEQAYKNIPFYLTNRDYGVFVNHAEKVSFEIASEKVSKVQFSVAGDALDYYVIGGSSLKEVIQNYTSLTGKPALPPIWSFGLWLSTSFTTQYDEKTVTHFIDGMRERQIPLHVFHFDCFWMKEYEWCNFEWDERVFPDPEGMLQRLHDRGLKVSVWINPYIAQKSPLFAEGNKHGYLLKQQNGSVWQWDHWQAGMGIVDFTNPDARTWYSNHLTRLLKMGVDCLKTDFGERIPTDVTYFDGSDPEKMHNYYTFLYNRTVFDTILAAKGKGEAVLFARSATAGSQQFPVHWGGDCSATYESMAESLRGGLSLSASGFGFWSHDIGGFENTATPDLYKRWAAFGLLSTHSRLHGNVSYRVPWLFDEEAVDVLRYFTLLKCQLMPYLFSAAREASLTGVPVMRPMVMEFSRDPGCDTLDRQYMLGSSLLVAPVFSEDGEVSFYLPAGKWTHFLSNEVVDGGTWYTQRYDYLSLPLFVRENSIVAIHEGATDPMYDPTDNIVLHVFALTEQSEAKAIVYDSHGDVLLEASVQRVNQSISIDVSQTVASWSIVMHHVHALSLVDNADIDETSEGIRLMPKSGNVTNIHVTL